MKIILFSLMAGIFLVMTLLVQTSYSQYAETCENPKEQKAFHPIDLEYEIDGGSILQICTVERSPEVVAVVGAYDDGHLTIHIPKKLVYSLGINCEQGLPLILEDGKEIAPIKTSTTESENVFTIGFTKGKHNIAFIGTMVMPGITPDQYCGIVMGLDSLYLPPKFQIERGIKAEQVRCNEGMVLVVKLSDDSPACIKPDTKTRLIDIGWMKTRVNVQNHSEFIESTKSLDEVKQFLSMHPDAIVSVDDKWHTVIYEASGFRKHPSSQIIYQTKRLIIDLGYDGKPEALSAECAGGGVTLSGPVDPLTNLDWCFPRDQSDFSNMLSNKTESNTKNTHEPYTTIEISFGNVTTANLLPVVFSEITHNAEYVNEILVWNFELIGHDGDDRRKTWDTVSNDQRIFYKITDEYGTNVIDNTRMPDNIDIPADLHLYSMNCGLFQMVDGESAHPTVFAVKKGTPTIIAKNSNKGIFPLSDDEYSFEFASIFETTVKLPKNAEIISQESKQCKLVQGIEGDADRTYTNGYYTKMVFSLEN